ncbi:hypothetical protein HanIR_Chr14g0689251 [Helianthus annuus]|nr:hypothetical protein HanIR_Chr14g0689251 [Helianthus annuus]
MSSQNHFNAPSNLFSFNNSIFISNHPDSCPPYVFKKLCIRRLIRPVRNCHHRNPTSHTLECRIPPTMCHKTT